MPVQTAVQAVYSFLALLVHTATEDEFSAHGFATSLIAAEHSGLSITLHLPQWNVDRLKIVSYAAMFASCSVMFSPAGTMLSIVKQGRNGKESPLPYFMLFTQAFLWMMYGVLTHHPDIVRINGLSSVVSCCYLLVLAAHANSQERHLVTPGILGGIAAVFSGSVAVLAFVHDPLRKIQILSDTAMVFTLGLSAAPMLQVVDVWKNRSLEGFPVPLVAVGAVSCALWSEYAVMINSLPYLIPNVVGVALNLVQLVVVGYVYVVYERKSRPASKADAVAEEKALLKEQYQATQQTEEA